MTRGAGALIGFILLCAADIIPGQTVNSTIVNKGENFEDVVDVKPVVSSNSTGLEQVKEANRSEKQEKVEVNGEKVTPVASEGSESIKEANQALQEEINELRKEVDKLRAVKKDTAQISCPPGQRSVNNTNCILCAAGEYSNGFSYDCKTCPPDTFQPEKGQTKCINCPEYSHTIPFHLGNKDIGDCLCLTDYSMIVSKDDPKMGQCTKKVGLLFPSSKTEKKLVKSLPNEDDHTHHHHKVSHLKPSEIGHQDPLFLPGLYHTSQFLMVALAGFQVGRYFRALKLPLISGYLIAGILSGPHLLGLLSHETTKDLRIIDQFSISCIAIAAGMELKGSKLAKFLRPIMWVLTGFMGATFVSSFLIILVFAGLIPFIAGTPATTKIAVALLISTIMIARSPASAIAIVKDSKAEGPFTTMVIGVSIAADVLIIVVFALNVGIAKALIHGSGLTISSLLSPILKILFSAVFGILVGVLMDRIAMSERLHHRVKDVLVLSSGLVAFFISSLVPTFFAFEPLLACVLGGIWQVNFGHNHAYHEALMDRALPIINIIFFTSAGAELELDHLLKAELLMMGLAIFVLRIGSLWLGATLGGWLAGRPAKETSFAWMGYVTQAGVAMGLAKDVAHQFPDWGPVFASMMIFQMAINQVVGPPLFKYAILAMGECRDTGRDIELKKSKSKANMKPVPEDTVKTMNVLI
mmetsp:Transcript_2091/g.3004  ORF Transcript_2091/g.3004 Transcript_2091/m.3004 type:complete len:696 (-) Transcript_2091:51-2138(-)